MKNRKPGDRQKNMNFNSNSDKKTKSKVIYYEDELNDEFSTAVIAPKMIDEKYQYINTGKWKKLTHFFWYRMIATPLAYLYMKIYFGHKIINRHIVKEEGKTGWFIYGNHTHFMADALVPSLISIPKDTYVIVHPNNVSMPVLGRITPSLGAVPLPDTPEAAKKFVQAVEKRIEQKNAVAIYPEAHIWPYYTKIRPFKETAFRYPVKCKVPVYCFTNTYQKRRFRKTPRMVTYVDGPFYPDEKLNRKMQQKQLREQVYETMVNRSKQNNVQIIRYCAKKDKGEERDD